MDFDNEEQCKDEFDLTTGISANLVGMQNIIDYFEKMQNSLKGASKLNKNVVLHPEHFVFYGNPGTGKTAIANIFAQYMYKIGIVESSELHQRKAMDLISQYVGGTAVKTTEFLNAGLGKVIFIDEAHQLIDQGSGSANNANYGKDVVKVLVPFLENHRLDCIVIIAGYEAQIKGMMDYDPGMPDRFTNWIPFTDYNNDQLVEIFGKMVSNWSEGNSQPESFTWPGKETAFSQQLNRFFEDIRVARKKNFGNARVARIIAKKTITNLYARLGNDENLPIGDGRKIILQDLPSLRDIQKAL